MVTDGVCLSLRGHGQSTGLQGGLWTVTTNCADSDQISHPPRENKNEWKNKREMLYQVIFSYFMENTIHMAKVGEGNKGLPSFLRH